MFFQTNLFCTLCSKNVGKEKMLQKCIIKRNKMVYSSANGVFLQHFN